MATIAEVRSEDGEWEMMPKELGDILRELWEQSGKNNDRYVTLQRERFGDDAQTYVMADWNEIWRRAEIDFDYWLSYAGDLPWWWSHRVRAYQEHAKNPNIAIPKLWKEWGRWQRAERDPERVFADRKDWPREITGDMLMQSTEDWVVRHYAWASLAWDAYVTIWPLPVGKSTRWDPWWNLEEPDDRWDKNEAQDIVDQMPFEDFAFAAFIFEFDYSNTHIEMFGTAIPRYDPDEPDRIESFGLGPARFRVTSNGSEPEQVAVICRNLSDWWERIGGKIMPRGRRPGTITYSRLEFVSMIREYAETHNLQPEQVRTDGFYEWTSCRGKPVNERSFKRWKKAWGSPHWRELVEEAFEGIY